MKSKDIIEIIETILMIYSTAKSRKKNKKKNK